MTKPAQAAFVLLHPEGGDTVSPPAPPDACPMTRGSEDASLSGQEELCGWRVILGAGREAPVLCSPAWASTPMGSVASAGAPHAWHLGHST